MIEDMKYKPWSDEEGVTNEVLKNLGYLCHQYRQDDNGLQIAFVVELGLPFTPPPNEAIKRSQRKSMKELFEGFMNIIATDNNNNTTKLERIVTIYKHVIEMYDLNKIYALDRYTALYPRLFDLASLMSGHRMTDDDGLGDHALGLLDQLCRKYLPHDMVIQKAFDFALQ